MATGEPKFGAGSHTGRADQDGQHRTMGNTDAATVSGQPSHKTRAARSPQDRWGAEDNMKVPGVNKMADAPDDTYQPEDPYKR